MDPIPLKTINSYRIGSTQGLSDDQLKQLAEIFDRPHRPENAVLGGRSSVAIQNVTGIGAVVVKYYTRGGLIRHFVKRSYVRWGKTRSQVEFELLQMVRGLGVKAPKPIAYAYRGTMIYKAWLVTEEIKQTRTLAQLSLSNPDLALSLIDRVVSQVSTLIENNLHHVDLHPGNVLVDDQSDTYLVDFDKARPTGQDRQKLREKYINRWRRAVIKHRLPEKLWKAFQTELPLKKGSPIKRR